MNILTVCLIKYSGIIETFWWNLKEDIWEYSQFTLNDNFTGKWFVMWLGLNRTVKFVINTVSVG